MKKQMKKAVAVFALLTLGIFVLGGCGKEDKLTMVTTEHTGKEDVASPTDETTLDTATEEGVEIEEASAEEKNITLQQIYEANTGDKLLAGKKGYSINRIYYLNGVETASEYEYMGFDSDGNYIQVYEDYNGYIQVLDNFNACWYVFTGSANDSRQLILIYPEDGLVSYLIEYTHLNMIFAYSEESGETIQDIYRADGDLTVETKYADENGDEYTIKYVIDENLTILEYTLYYPDGSMGVYAWTTPDVEYSTPDFVMDMKDDTETRTVTVIYPNGDGEGTTYEISATYPIDIRLTNHQAYLDADCQIEWSATIPDEYGRYPDETIYLAE